VTGSATRVTLARGAYREFRRVSTILRLESVGGILLLAGAVAALLAANLVPDSYVWLRDLHLGGEPFGLHLNLSLGHWAADGLLALFFFLVGLELKQEFVTGELRNPQTALVPVVAAFGGVAVPALIYLGFNLADPATGHGWAIPAATDIAFALAVLAVIGSHLPAALRTFLLTLSVADDLIAITIIAFFYTNDLRLEFLAGALVPLVAFALLVNLAHGFWLRHPWARLALLVVAGVTTWVLVYSSGVHATVAGVLLAFCVPVRPPKGSQFSDGLAEVFDHRLRPLSAGFAVPIFAFFSAGVTLGGWDGFVAAATSNVGLGVIVGLVAGKVIGITGATWLVTRLRHARLDPDLSWVDLFGLSILGGIGFTVSLLVSELTFGQGSVHDGMGKVAVLTASVLAAALAAVVLGARNRHYRAIAESEEVDADADGVPDKFAGA